MWKENKVGSKFCANCGTMLETIHIIKSQTKKEETILKIFNCLAFSILSLTVLYYLFRWLTFAFICSFFGIACIEALNNPNNSDFKSIVEGEWLEPLTIFC